MQMQHAMPYFGPVVVVERLAAQRFGNQACVFVATQFWPMWLDDPEYSRLSIVERASLLLEARGERVVAQPCAQ